MELDTLAKQRQITDVRCNGGAIDYAAAETNPNIVLVLDPGGIHSTAFLNQDYYAKESSSQQIQTWVKAILGL